MSNPLPFFLRGLFFLLWGWSAGFGARAQSQTTLLSENFEGTSTAFTLVNGTQPNKWFVGAAAGNGPTAPGGAAAYISNSATGATHTYTLTSYSTTFLYADVTFPAGQNQFDLSFDWKAMGQVVGLTPYDYLAVYLLATTDTPVAGQVPYFSTAVLVADNLHSQGQYARKLVRLPSGELLAGTTRRLVFMWRNDGTLGAQPPAALDNVTLTGTTVGPLSGTYTIDNGDPDTGRNFSSFTNAIARLNLTGVSGPTTFEVAAGRTFVEDTPNLTTGGTAAAPVVFRRSGNGPNPVIEAGYSAGAGIAIIGADWLTFDGIDVRSNPNDPLQNGYYVMAQQSGRNGARHITIRNATIALTRLGRGSSAASAAGIRQANVGFASDTAGVHRHIVYENLTISNCIYGVRITGSDAAFPDELVTVRNVSVSTGTLPGQGTLYGFAVEDVKGLTFENNAVRGLSSNNSVYGIDLRDLQGTGPWACRVANNQVYELRRLGANTSYTGYYVWGLTFYQNSNVPGIELDLYNNEVRDLSLDYTGPATSTRNICGLFLNIGVPGAGSRFRVWHNSVRVEGGSLAYTTAACEANLGADVQAVMSLRNNIFASQVGAQSGVARHYAYRTVSSASYTAARRFADYNDLVVTNAANGYIGALGSTDYATLAAWQAASGQEPSGVSLDPQWPATGPLLPASATLDNLAAPLGLATDLTGRRRSSSAPDLGAYEFGTIILHAAPAPAAAAFTVFPVPFAGRLTLALPAHAAGAGRLALLDATGRVVRERAVQLSGVAGPLVWEGLETLPPGVYVLQLATAAGPLPAVRVQRW